MKVRLGGGRPQRDKRVGGLAAATTVQYILTELGKDPSHLQGKIQHIWSFPIVRHLVQLPVATYRSSFQTCQVISSIKPNKDQLQQNVWSDFEKRQKASELDIF
jgi:hypothetical protein